MGIKYRVMAGVGKYSNRDGNEKTRWQQCGAVFEKDGKLSMKLDTVPVGEWNGWLSFFEPDQDKPKQGRQNTQSSPDFDDWN